MKKKATTKKIVKQENGEACSWFDTENARLIIFCALFGIFGVHKFAQKKIFQGICFILLDLTIVGLVVSWIWAWFGLIALTVKKDNKPGNMIFGTVFIWISVLSMSMCLEGFLRPNTVELVSSTGEVITISDGEIMKFTDTKAFDSRGIVDKKTSGAIEKAVKHAEIEKAKREHHFVDLDHGHLPEKNPGVVE